MARYDKEENANLSEDSKRMMEFAKKVASGKRFKVGKYTIYGVNANKTFYNVKHGRPPKRETVHSQKILQLLKTVGETEIESPTGPKSWGGSSV